MRIFFGSPYTGDNFFYVENDIPEVQVSFDWGPGASGHPEQLTLTVIITVAYGALIILMTLCMHNCIDIAS